MTTNVLEAASNRHSIKSDISADVAYSIARSQQATEEFKIFAIITTRIVRPLLSLASSVELQPMSLGHDADRDRAGMRVGDSVSHREQLAGPPECGHPRRCNKHIMNGLRHALHAPSELSEIWREFGSTITGGQGIRASNRPASSQRR